MRSYQWIPVGGLIATIVTAGYMVVQLHGQAVSATDFTNAATAQVRDAQGQIVLQGDFKTAAGDDDEIEREATLAPTGADPDATGVAEIEFDKTAPSEQEIEFSARNLQPQASFTFVIDGTDVATATANQNGRVEVEMNVRMP